MDAIAARPGVCRFCECTCELPCISLDTGEPCAWLEDTNDTVCSSSTCVEQWNALLAGAADHPRRLPW